MITGNNTKQYRSSCSAPGLHDLVKKSHSDYCGQYCELRLGKKKKKIGIMSLLAARYGAGN